jgi:hypothetical protein
MVDGLKPPSRSRSFIERKWRERVGDNALNAARTFSFIASVTPATNSGVAMTTLFSRNLPNLLLKAPGETLHYEAWGSVIGSVNNKTIQMAINGTVFFNTGAMAIAATTEFYLTGAFTYDQSNHFTSGRFHSNSANYQSVVDNTSAFYTLNQSPNVIRIQAQGGASNEINCEVFRVWFMQRPVTSG